MRGSERIKFRFHPGRIALALLLAFVWLAMYVRGMGEWYAQHIYPSVSFILSSFSALFPFSLSDCLIYGSIAGLPVYLLYGLIRKKRFLHRILRTAEFLLWIYAWFYMAWGLNYFRDGFYQRAGVEPASYSAGAFRTFLSDYTALLNETCCEDFRVTREALDAAVKEGYENLSAELRIMRPEGYLRPKPMLFSSLMSAVGVKGYIGPFFVEYTLNRDLLPEEQPFTCAHEMAHVLGVSNEAEANLCGYLACMSSDVQAIRFSALFSLFPYVLGNAYRLYSEEEFKAWVESVRPEVLRLYENRRAYWQSLYSPFVGEMQDWLYNIFLKSNRIPSGTANYSEVVALLMAYRIKL